MLPGRTGTYRRWRARPERVVMPASMIDWNVAVQTGTRLLRPGPQVSPREAREVVTELRELSAVAQGHVRAFTGMDGVADASQAKAVDRPGEIQPNDDGCRVAREPLI